MFLLHKQERALPACPYHVLSPPNARDKTQEVNMKKPNREKIICQAKMNCILFTIKSIWNTFWYSIGIALSMGLGTLLASGIAGFICNNGKMNTTILNIGFRLIPLLIIIRILHIILLRRNQFYIITDLGITSKGGVLNRFEQTLLNKEIQSVSYTQTLIQQILGCGNIVISSAATYRAGIVLTDIDDVKKIYHIINQNR